MLKILLMCIFLTSSIVAKENRYIFYDVNPGEGFNLRRDVFGRIAVMVKKLNQNSKKFSYTLVLPPWGPLYHWQTRSIGDQVKIPWKLFFQVESISRFVPSIDLEDYLKTEDGTLDVVYNLQNYAGGWENGQFREKLDIQECINHHRYRKVENIYQGFFWTYPNMASKEFHCLSIQGTTSIMRDFIEEKAQKFKTIMIDRAENLLHESFGDADYWSVRRSMRFNKDLVKISDDFRHKNLDSSDEKDSTLQKEKWENQRAERGSAKGGPFICAHVRRKDYTFSRKDQIPDLKSAAQQLAKKAQEQKVTKIFISSDAPESEIAEIQNYLPENLKVFRFKANQEILKLYKDGGVAIIDQIICSHAKYFIGSYESTFTFRIQEEREIMGFEVDKTFDMLCKSGEFNCQKGNIWKIVYDSVSRDEL